MTRTLTLLLAVLAACAPAQRRLLAARQYPEALAGVDEGALDGGAVLSTIAGDLELGAHLQAVPSDMLRATLPGSPAGFDDLALVRVIHDSHTIPLAAYEVSFALLQAGAPVPAVDTSIAALARRSGETLPKDQVIEHEGTTDYRLVVRTRRPLLEIFARVLVNVATVGLLHPVVPIVRDHGSPAYSEVRRPTPDDYAQNSPAAESLLRWLTPAACDRPGQRCEQYVLWPRELTGPLELLVVVRIGWYRHGALLYRVPLPPGPLEQGLLAVFGDRMRPLDELTRAAGQRPQLTYMLPEPEFAGQSLTPRSRKDLCARLGGGRRRPGLLSRPELRFTLELGEHVTDGEQQALQLRAALLACGVSAAQIELAEVDGYDLGLRVHHAFDVTAPDRR
jgi:hypothetical protein